jgi:cytochrome b
VLLPSLWWSWKSGDIQLHEKLGYVTLGILLFRLYWGLCGSSTARFTHFVKGPRAIAAYLRGNSEVSVGHNPLGALSVLALLGLMIVEVGLGLFAQDVDGIEAGPLAVYVSYETSDWARGWHELLFNVILAVVAIHVLAILFYLVLKRDNLVGPMITGHKSFDRDVEEPRRGSLANVVVGMAISAAIAWFVSNGAKV